MKAGEAWWSEKDDHFSAMVDKMCPPSINIKESIKGAIVKSPGNRDGIGFSASAIEEMRPITAHYSTWKESKMIELASEEATTRADAALKNLEDHLVKFRSKVGNDLTSIKAASQRVQTEAQAMTEKYVKAQAMLTSPDFERAILNAERMATALEAIGRLSETKLSFAVFSGSNKADLPES